MVHESPTALFSLYPRVTDLLDPTINFTDLSSETSTQWNWDFGNGYWSTIQNPTYTYNDDGLYYVTLTVETDFGCTASATDSVTINPPFSFYIPNSFTPNNDGINDLFGGYGIGVETYEMSIFNRWGEHIFHSAAMYHFWDGSYKGKQVELATYVYECYIVDVNGQDHHYLGAVTIYN